MATKNNKVKLFQVTLERDVRQSASFRVHARGVDEAIILVTDFAKHNSITRWNHATVLGNLRLAGATDVPEESDGGS